MHMHTCSSRREEVIYEVVAEPQEQSERAKQEVPKDSAQGPAEPSVEQQPEGKPRCMSY